MPNSVYTPTPQNPSYPASVSGVTGTTTYVVGSGTASSTVTVPAYTFNGLSSADLTIASNNWITKPIIEMGLSNSVVGVVFNTTDGSTDIKLTFAPEPNMTISELMKIMMFVTMANAGRVSRTDAFDYVRAHSLERHFKFTV